MMSMADMFTQFFSSTPPSDEEPEDTINNNSPKGDLNNGKLLEVLKEGKSKEEQNQIDRMMEMTKNIFRKHFK